MDFVSNIERLIKDSLESMGYDIVRIQLQGGKRKTLQIMIDRLDAEEINLDDCSTVSRTISALLDVEDPLEEAYSLEVSSPGIDRPLTRMKDFERFKGHLAKVELKLPQDDGRKRFEGVLMAPEGDLIRIELKEPVGAVREFAFEDIQRAKLVPVFD